MRKRIFAVATATVMSMAFAMTAMADAPDDYTAYYDFNENLVNAADQSEAQITGTLVTKEPTVTSALFDEGTDGQGILLDTTYGLKLGQYITDDVYTVSYNIKLNNATFGTAGVFVESMNGSATPEQWDSIMPEVSAGAFLPRVWSNDPSGHRYTLEVTDADLQTKLGDNLGVWTNITFVKGAEIGTLYVNGEIVAKGFVETGSAVVDDGADPNCTGYTVNETTIEWLGVNYWDVPLDAVVDELYIYDRDLTDDEVAALTGYEIVDSVGELEVPQWEVPALDNTDYSVKVETKTDSDSTDNNLTLIISVVIVVVAVVVCVAVVASSKKKPEKTEE